MSACGWKPACPFLAGETAKPTFVQAELRQPVSHDVKDSAATPAKIVRAAADEVIAIISLADHNEVANIPAAQAAGAEHGVFVVPGVELSTPARDRE